MELALYSLNWPVIILLFLSLLLLISSSYIMYIYEHTYDAFFYFLTLMFILDKITIVKPFKNTLLAFSFPYHQLHIFIVYTYDTIFLPTPFFSLIITYNDQLVLFSHLYHHFFLLINKTNYFAKDYFILDVQNKC